MKGILITNLGTPDAPTPKAIRVYLKEFLSDIRVVDAPRIIWFFVLKVILAIRPGRVAEGYRAVWTEQGSPLLKISKDQQQALQAAFGDTPVALGMRYGNPSIASALDELVAKGCDDITVLPLYPQYSATTTASTFDAIADWSKQQRKLPSLRFIRDYYQSDAWVSALANSVREHWQAQGRGEKLLMSFHGIPQRYCDLGDPYLQQ
ncbi:MAG: ferrochelatase, partial [Gammaproteobacteria bacterium]|nr:ferrochelatase [Gammaproteobacteria bacterium]